ncbi:LysR family transcriptional regulator [Cupriavidus basilensis]
MPITGERAVSIDMHRIDPVNIQLFLSVAREGSIKRAAEIEHIAQSALSRRMAELERSLGVVLFVRSPSGVALTDAGARALELGRKLNEDIAAFAREVQDLETALRGWSASPPALRPSLDSFRSVCMPSGWHILT